VSPHDPLSLAAAIGVLGLSAILAAWLPSRRAARVDPAVSLRSD
jgi:ABC-type lipoprotein release transport system permease subunit